MVDTFCIYCQHLCLGQGKVWLFPWVSSGKVSPLPWNPWHSRACINNAHPLKTSFTSHRIHKSTGQLFIVSSGLDLAKRLCTLGCSYTASYCKTEREPRVSILLLSSYSQYMRLSLLVSASVTRPKTQDSSPGWSTDILEQDKSKGQTQVQRVKVILPSWETSHKATCQNVWIKSWRTGSSSPNGLLSQQFLRLLNIFSRSLILCQLGAG